jgi:tocopherol cyclase
VITFDNGRGYTEKDFGRSFPSMWVWLQTNSFPLHPGTSLFVSVARVPVLGFGLPGFTAAVWHDSTLFPFATWSGATFEDMRVSDDEVFIAVRGGRRPGGGVGGGGGRHRVEITVDRRNVPEVLLYAPVNFTRMMPHVREALRARVHMRLFDGRGNVLVDDVGLHAGLEVHGNVRWLVDNVCGRESANKFVCL